MSKYRCSNCGTVVDDTQEKCHECNSLFVSDEQTKSIAKSVFTALTGDRAIEDIKDDWIYEVRRSIVGGVQKTFGVDGDGGDTFKKPPKRSSTIGDIIDVEFEVVEEDGTLKKQPKGTQIKDLPKNVQDALKRKMQNPDNDETQDS